MYNEHIQHKINSLIRSLQRPPTLITKKKKNARAAQIFESPQHPLYVHERPSNTPRVAGQHSINKTPNNHNQLNTHFPIPPKLVLPDARCCCCYCVAAGWWWCCSSSLLMHTASRACAYYLFAHRAAHYLNIIPCASCSPKPHTIYIQKTFAPRDCERFS